jgi:hypothetical protein
MLGVLRIKGHASPIEVGLLSLSGISPAPKGFSGVRSLARSNASRRRFGLPTGRGRKEEGDPGWVVSRLVVAREKEVIY